CHPQLVGRRVHRSIRAAWRRQGSLWCAADRSSFTRSLGPRGEGHIPNQPPPLPRVLRGVSATGPGIAGLPSFGFDETIRQTPSVESNSKPGKNRRIQQTLSVESRGGQLVLAPKLLLRFSWSKIIELLRVDDLLK